MSICPAFLTWLSSLLLVGGDAAREEGHSRATRHNKGRRAFIFIFTFIKKKKCLPFGFGLQEQLLLRAEKLASFTKKKSLHFSSLWPYQKVLLLVRIRSAGERLVVVVVVRLRASPKINPKLLAAVKTLSCQREKI